MNTATLQGFFDRPRALFAPVAGFSIRLNEHTFLKMLGLAFAVHVIAFTIAALIPREEVTDIPVRAIAFKLGGPEKIAPLPPPPAAPSMSVQPLPPLPPIVAPAPQPAPPPVAAPKAEPKPAPKPAPRKAKTYKVTDQPVPETPHHYVREVGAAPRQASIPTGTAEIKSSAGEAAVQAIRARYEQDISAWIQRHKIYPEAAGGREGRAIVRMRIDRFGNVRYYAIEQSAGIAALDAAALDMIRRANPMPAVPMNYPDGNLVEFLIPISFKAP